MAAVEALSPLLNSALTDPTDAQVMCYWFRTLAEHCPLWTLQRKAYRTYEPDRLGGDIAWCRMESASSDEKVGGPGLGLSSVFEPDQSDHAAWTFKTPFVEAKKRYGEGALALYKEAAYSENRAARYLVQAYRCALIVGGPKVGPYDFDATRLPDTFDSDLHEPDEPRDYHNVDPRLAALGDLVQKRTAARSQEEKDEAQADIEDYLRAIELDRARKLSIPNAESLVRELAVECGIWLGSLDECKLVRLRLSDTAEQRLNEWGCTENPQIWALQFALPFLSRRESQYLSQLYSLTDLPLAAVRVIHARVDPILALRTVGDHAFGETWVNDHKKHLSSNPILA